MKIDELVNDLCILQAGWKTENQGKAYSDAYRRVAAHAHKMYKQHEIEVLKKRLEELENA